MLLSLSVGLLANFYAPPPYVAALFVALRQSVRSSRASDFLETGKL